jgi:hypothetical protein
VNPKLHTAVVRTGSVSDGSADRAVLACRAKAGVAVTAAAIATSDDGLQGDANNSGDKRTSRAVHEMIVLVLGGLLR